MRITLLTILIGLFAIPGMAQKTITGFKPANQEEQLKLEARFDASLKAENLDKWMKRLTARPHHVGSPYGKANAEFMRDLFQSFGFDAAIESYQVPFPVPVLRVLEMTAPTKFTAKLSEPPLKEDGTSALVSEQLPTYNAWSADGDVTGELVYVNYGVPDDYEVLKRMGIDVKGKIVIARYGGSWRGIKPKVAQEHGAIGCLIYSDPKDDGYSQGDVYPKGPYRPKDGAQRGSVLDMPIYPGDPLTPNEPAIPGTKRLKREEAVNLIRIPVLPISYGDAQPLLAALGGPVAPENWRGTLPITYHIGPGSAKVHLKLQFEWKTVECMNVIAKLKGSEFPDQWVIRGNHHDGWVNGAADPVSSLVAELEEARAIGELVKSGWKPKRTLVYCAWDGEEPSLMGSTEWVEHHASELTQKAVAYINTDGNGRGFFGAEGSHTLETMINEVSRDVIDPETGITVQERRRAILATTAGSARAKREILGSRNLSIGALGSGSDYSPFIQHLGVPAINLGYGGEGGGGVYHSVYDSYDHYKRFGDPGFTYGVTLTKTAGRIALRLANADVVPFEFTTFYKTLNGYLNEVMALATSLRESTEVENQLIRENRYVQASDPTTTYVAPVMQEPVPYLNFSNLQNAVARLEKLTQQLGSMNQVPAPSVQMERFNQLLYTAEQKLLQSDGLPRRPWYKHSIYAPGFYTGYGVKTLPGIREAIEQRNYVEAQEQIEKTAAAVNAYANQLDAIVKLLMQR